MRSTKTNTHRSLGQIIGIAVAALCLSGLSFAAPEKETEAALLEKARAIHERVVVIDAHADIVLPTTNKQYLGADGLSKTAPDKLKTGGVNAVVMTAGIGYGPRTAEGDEAARAVIDEELIAARKLAEENPDLVAIATSPGDITAIKADGKTALLLGFQNARALERDIDVIDDLYSAGVRVFALNHLGHNDFSDSSRPNFDGAAGAYEVEEEHGGLSGLGRTAIKRINAIGGIVDVSQMSKNATLQTIELSKAPVIASHSNVKSLSNVTRNLSDEEIDRIGETGGVIHVAVFSAYLVDLSDPALLARIKQVRDEAGLPETYSYPFELYWEIEDPEKRTKFVLSMRDTIGRSSVDRLIDHIDYIVERVGIDHVGIGSDFNHGGGIEGFNDASEAFNLTLGLVRRGYSEDEIAKIWGGNFLRVFAEVERAAK